MPQGPLAATTFKTQNNVQAPGLLDQQSAQFVSPRHGKLYLSTYGVTANPNASPSPTVATAGLNFRGSNTAGVTLSAALATTYVGICLSNPAGSTVNLVVKRVGAILIVAPSGNPLGIGLITGWSTGGIVTHTTPLTSIVAGYVGAATASGSVKLPAAAQGLVDSACTLVGTPVWDRWLTSVLNAAVGGGTFDIEDDLIVPPGGYVAVGANVGGPSSGFLGSFQWEELPP